VSGGKRLRFESASSNLRLKADPLGGGDTNEDP
jgi:hypothetical protein